VALFLINRAVRLAGNVEKECAILADRVHHPADITCAGCMYPPYSPGRSNNLR
jgi:hypothetical protein